MVRLKEESAQAWYAVGRSFNSIMVRLKVINTVIHCQVIVEFQFHYGTIKSLNGIGFQDLTTGFNSIMVRLKVFLQIELRRRTLEVSIPLWYD